MNFLSSYVQFSEIQEWIGFCLQTGHMAHMANRSHGKHMANTWQRGHMAWLDREALRMKESLARKTSCLQQKGIRKKWPAWLGHSKDLCLKPIIKYNDICLMWSGSTFFRHKYFWLGGRVNKLPRKMYHSSCRLWILWSKIYDSSCRLRMLWISASFVGLATSLWITKGTFFMFGSLFVSLCLFVWVSICLWLYLDFVSRDSFEARPRTPRESQSRRCFSSSLHFSCSSSSLSSSTSSFSSSSSSSKSASVRSEQKER